MLYTLYILSYNRRFPLFLHLSLFLFLVFQRVSLICLTIEILHGFASDFTRGLHNNVVLRPNVLRLNSTSFNRNIAFFIYLLIIRTKIQIIIIISSARWNRRPWRYSRRGKTARLKNRFCFYSVSYKCDFSGKAD